MVLISKIERVKFLMDLDTQIKSRLHLLLHCRTWLVHPTLLDTSQTSPRMTMVPISRTELATLSMDLHTQITSRLPTMSSKKRHLLFKRMYYKLLILLCPAYGGHRE